MAVCLGRMKKGMITLGGNKNSSECSPAFSSCHTACFRKVYSKLQLLTFPHDLKSLSDLFIDILVLVLQRVRKECGN